MEIAGFTPFTSTDYPDKLACVVWTQGCPAWCRYCYNKSLCPFTEGKLSWVRIHNHLVSRQGLLDAVVFSGGEPLIHNDLAARIGEVKSLGYKVGLHTSGYCSRRLEAIWRLLDWVKIDYKYPPWDMKEKTGLRYEQVEGCISLLRDRDVHFEVTTVAHPELSKRHLVAIRHRMRELSVENRWKTKPYYEVDNSGNLRHPGGREDEVRSVVQGNGLSPAHRILELGEAARAPGQEIVFGGEG